MSDLPPGFVLDQPEPPQGLPSGFVLDGAPEQSKKQFGLSDTWPARLAKSVYSAITLPGDVAAGRAQVPQSANMPGGESTENIGRVTDLAGIATPMAPRAGATIARPVSGPPTAEQLSAAGAAGFDKARGMGVEIRPPAVAESAGALRSTLEKDGINAELAPKTFSILSRLEDPPQGAVAATIGDFETVRRTLGNAAKDFANPTEQLAAKRSQQHFNDYLSSVPERDVLAGDAAAASQTIREAIANYAAGKRSEKVADAVEAADLSAAAANSGKNIGNAERQKFKSIALSDKQSAGFSPEEMAQIERIVRGTRTGNTLRHVGNFLGGGGGLGQVASTGFGAAVGGGVGGPVGAAVGAVASPAIGNIARILSNASTKRQVGILDEMVRSRSPLAQQLGGEGVEQFLSDPKRAAVVRALLESRSAQ